MSGASRIIQDMNQIPEDISSFVNQTAVNPAERLRRYRPTTVKKIAAWGAVIFGVVMLATMFSGTSGSLIGDILLSVGFAVVSIVPGGYWLLCNRRDSALVTNWILANRDYQANWEMLAADERELFARPEQLPVIPERRWKTVWTIVFVGFVVAMVGSAFLPDPDSTGGTV